MAPRTSQAYPSFHPDEETPRIQQEAVNANAGLASLTASAISNTPAGNLASTNVQAALNELQTDVDTRATSAALTAHTGASSGAHPASAISNAPSGNLASTDVQAALNEVQSDVDTRATSAALTAHTGASSAVHGVTGSVVGTSDAQTLTNKTFSDTVKASVFSALTGAAATLKGLIADGATAVANIIDTGVALTTTGAAILNLRNNGTTKAAVDKDGGYAIKGSGVFTFSDGTTQATAPGPVAVYTTATAQSIPNGGAAGTVINFDTVVTDGSSLVTTGSGWKFTAAVTGKYLVSAQVQLAVPASTSYDIEFGLLKNGVFYSDLARPAATAAAGFTNNVGCSGSLILPLSATDYVQVFVYQTSGASRSLNGAGTANRVSIVRIAA